MYNKFNVFNGLKNNFDQLSSNISGPGLHFVIHPPMYSLATQVSLPPK